MHRQTAFKLLYDILYITINRKNEQIKAHNRLKYVQIKKYKKYIYIFLHYIRMEPTSQNNGINAIKEARKIFNEVRSNLSREETNRIRKKLYKKEDDYNFLKKKEQEGSLTNIQKNELRNVERYLKNIGMHLQNFKKYLKELERYQYGLDHLFNEEEDYITEPLTSNNSINARKLFNEVRSNLSREETNEIR